MKKLWIGRALSGIVLLFLAADALMHIIRIQPVIEAFNKLSIPVDLSELLGAIVLACLALYAFRRTRVVGTILLTGYLGGAVAIHLRAGSSAFECVFPILIGAMLWTGLYLCDGRVRALLAEA